MPFRVLFANPIALAAVAVIAIGVITYQIISQNQKKTYENCPRRRRKSINYPRDYPTSFDKPDNSPKPDNGSTKPKKTDTGSSESRKPENGPSEPRKPDNDSTESKNPTNKFCDVKKCSNSLNGSFSENPGFSGNVSGQIQSIDRENDKIVNGIENISQNDLRKPDFVKNIDDEDSDTSESNSSSNSIETNVTRSNAESAQYLYGSIPRSESFSSMEDKNCGETSFFDTEEELYKKKIYYNLKNDVEDVNLGSKNYNDDNSDFSELDISVNSDNASGSGAKAKKRIMCKGCEEELANAVAYPCEHCYLCFDCAVKVHRIYKKCTICNSVIETYETL